MMSSALQISLIALTAFQLISSCKEQSQTEKSSNEPEPAKPPPIKSDNQENTSKNNARFAPELLPWKEGYLSLEQIEARYEKNMRSPLPEYATKLRGYQSHHAGLFSFAFDLPVSRKKDFEQHLISSGIPEDVILQEHYGLFSSIPNSRQMEDYRKLADGWLFFSKEPSLQVINWITFFSESKQEVLNIATY